VSTWYLPFLIRRGWRFATIAGKLPI
jgi:hypothetical protein